MFTYPLIVIFTIYTNINSTNISETTVPCTNDMSILQKKKSFLRSFSIVQITDGEEFSHNEEVDFHISYQSLKMSMDDEGSSFNIPVSFDDFEQVILMCTCTFLDIYYVCF